MRLSAFVFVGLSVFGQGTAYDSDNFLSGGIDTNRWWSNPGSGTPGLSGSGFGLSGRGSLIVKTS
jgi:hypothetical protein